MRLDIPKILIAFAILSPAQTVAGNQVTIDGFARSSIPATDAQGQSTILSSSDIIFPLPADEENEKYWVVINGKRLALERRHIIIPKTKCTFSFSSGNNVAAGTAGANSISCPVDMGRTK